MTYKAVCIVAVDIGQIITTSPSRPTHLRERMRPLIIDAIILRARDACEHNQQSGLYTSWHVG